MTEKNMEEQKDEIDEQKSVYLGNALPKVLRFAYVAFIGWAAFYLIKYLFPDLMKWLR